MQPSCTAKIIPLHDVVNIGTFGEYVWLEIAGERSMYYIRVFSHGVETILFDVPGDVYCLDHDTYNINWRVWDSLPTDELRKKVPLVYA